MSICRNSVCSVDVQTEKTEVWAEGSDYVPFAFLFR